MINRSFLDNTQESILPILKVTEELISRSIEKETGKDGCAEIVAMPDLGFANNYIRMKGGFYTGLYAKWSSCIPYVPVDSTVNSCGVSFFILEDDVSPEEFKSRIDIAKGKMSDLSLNWNFERGNHFITLCKCGNGKTGLLMHASADEYKRSIAGSALYPFPGVWYYPDLKTIEHPSVQGRYLRYLIGNSAEKFISIARSLEDINHKRMIDVADLILGDKIKSERIYVPHYGMPTDTSVAIGCSWHPNESMLLTVPGHDVYLIKHNELDGDDQLWLTPHGFGSSSTNPIIKYDKNSFIIDNVKIENDDDVKSVSGKGIRLSNGSNIEVKEHALKVMDKCDASIVSTISPLASICASGFIKF